MEKKNANVEMDVEARPFAFIIKIKNDVKIAGAVWCVFIKKKKHNVLYVILK